MKTRTKILLASILSGLLSAAPAIAGKTGGPGGAGGTGKYLNQPQHATGQQRAEDVQQRNDERKTYQYEYKEQSRKDGNQYRERNREQQSGLSDGKGKQKGKPGNGGGKPQSANQ